MARWVFTDRTQGHSQGAYQSLNLASHVGDAAFAVAMNRASVAQHLRLPVDKLSWSECVHGTDIVELNKAVGAVPLCDGLFTQQRKTPVLALGADCVPLLLIDPTSRWVAAVHCGWKGAADGMMDSIERLLKSHARQAKNVVALAGPSICGNCYTVDQSRRDAVAAQLPQAVSGAGLDLRAGLIARLQKLGVQASAIGPCTFESAEHFSYRRDTQTGRQAGLVMLL